MRNRKMKTSAEKPMLASRVSTPGYFGWTDRYGIYDPANAYDGCGVSEDPSGDKAEKRGVR